MMPLLSPVKVDSRDSDRKAMRVVALSSGGVDSSIMMLLLKREGFQVFPLHINYGQRAEREEWPAHKRVCKFLGLIPERINLQGFNKIPSALTREDMDIVRDAFLPTRNLLFATVGAAFAFGRSIEVVAIGLLSNPIFPDQTPTFVQSAAKCIKEALGNSFQLLAPLIGLDKTDTLSLARKHGLPLNLTYHCHAGGKQDCGRCISCKERLAAESSIDEGAGGLNQEELVRE
jgi:7-cyano-7-deazaguanine synthase